MLSVTITNQLRYAAGSYSDWAHAEPYNPTGNVNCAVMESSEDQVYWMDYACSRSNFGALCDLGPSMYCVLFCDVPAK